MHVADHLTLDELRDRADAGKDKRLFLRFRAVYLAATGKLALNNVIALLLLRCQQVLPSKDQCPGPLRSALGTFGEHLAKQKMARVLIPVQDVAVQQAPLRVVQVAAPAQPAAYQYAAPAAGPAPVLATPQAPSKHRLSLFGR